MDTNALKKFAQSARNLLIDQISAKLGFVLDPASSARREQPEAVKNLEGAIRVQGERQIIEQVAYTWFNRFTALRFMDVNAYTNPRVVSPADGATRPEILAEAMAGNLPDNAPTTIQSLLDGRTPSHDPQAEAYRLLLVHACNAWHNSMPFLFEKVGDYTELLMPEDLLSPTSILANLREAMAEDACTDVEIIGWLYQFYISEKKDQVFAGLKKNIKITAENIPAATQLFTPHWIVRYLVENSLGRLWLLNRPASKLAERMDYYIAPEEPETDFLRIDRPEDIKLCDPACGSGHMLTYAFDLLHAIYEEEGYDPAEIPALILTHNLTGIEIDDRAGALAAFALAMKAAGKLGRRRFLRLEVKPNIVVLQNVAFTSAELTDVAAVVGQDLFTDELRETLVQFEQAKSFGSLIVPKLRDPAETLRVVIAQDFGSDLYRRDVQGRVLDVLRMAEALSPKYHVVVANPPYMGVKGMNGGLGGWLKSHFPNSNSDLFSAFMDRILDSLPRGAFGGLMTPFTWMFLSSFTALRDKLTSDFVLSSLIRPEYHAFFDSAYVPICAFTIEAKADAGLPGTFIDLQDFYGAAFQPIKALEAIKKTNASWRHSATSADFRRIPGQPIAYWVSDKFRRAFEALPSFREVAAPRAGLATGDNPQFQRDWYEVPLASVAFDCASNEESMSRSEKWYPCNSGGNFRKWFGNNEVVVNWQSDGAEIRNFKDANGKLRSRPQNTDYFFRPGVTWTKLSSSNFAARLREPGFIFDDTGRSAFPQESTEIPLLLAHMCSSAVNTALKILNPSMSVTSGDIANLPFVANAGASVAKIVEKAVQVTKSDWDAYETSWDFTTLPLLLPDYRAGTLAATYTRLRAHWQGMTDEMQRLEEENNRIFIDAYGLQDELTPEVPIEEITLTCNPAYRYGIKGSEEERESRLCADTMAEFLSYAVGCMFGRYSLDAPGLILANQGETLADYLARVPEPSYMPDEDNVIPVLDGDWFSDDISERFRRFLRVTFGEENFRENLTFIEAQIGDIRKYFTKKFYEDHLKRYKKRPIYWMFASPKGSFQALIYMHRYRPDTVSVLLNDYLREFIRKLAGERTKLENLSDDPSASQAQRTRALKDVSAIARQIAELEEWERDVIFPLAQQKIDIDLDDGVKRNYPRFGSALKPIKGLETTDE